MGKHHLTCSTALTDRPKQLLPTGPRLLKSKREVGPGKGDLNRGASDRQLSGPGQKGGSPGCYQTLGKHRPTFTTQIRLGPAPAPTVCQEPWCTESYRTLRESVGVSSFYSLSPLKCSLLWFRTVTKEAGVRAFHSVFLFI